jgi:hypothetical protein
VLPDHLDDEARRWREVDYAQLGLDPAHEMTPIEFTVGDAAAASVGQP